MTRVLLPGRLVRHIADVGAPGPFQGATWYPLTRLCDGGTKRAGSPFIEQPCEFIESVDLTDPLASLSTSPPTTSTRPWGPSPSSTYD